MKVSWMEQLRIVFELCGAQATITKLKHTVIMRFQQPVKIGNNDLNRLIKFINRTNFYRLDKALEFRVVHSYGTFLKWPQ
jgi:hypothetical protein